MEKLSSTVGKKLVVAVTGLIWVGYVIAHMTGNLKIFQGPDAFNGYARFLRDVGYPLVPHGALLWTARVTLILALVLHVVCVVQLSLLSRRARGVPYRRPGNLSFSFASSTMRWGGVALLAFIVYHLMHLTWGTAHPSFDHDSPYWNVVAGFQDRRVAIPYGVAVLALGLHVYHGLWSTTQTLGLSSDPVRRWSRLVSSVVAISLVIGYLAVPAAVLTGWLRLP